MNYDLRKFPSLRLFPVPVSPHFSVCCISPVQTLNRTWSLQPGVSSFSFNHSSFSGQGPPGHTQLPTVSVHTNQQPDGAWQRINIYNSWKSNYLNFNLQFYWLAWASLVDGTAWEICLFQIEYQNLVRIMSRYYSKSSQTIQMNSILEAISRIWVVFCASSTKIGSVKWNTVKIWTTYFGHPPRCFLWVFALSPSSSFWSSLRRRSCWGYCLAWWQ